MNVVIWRKSMFSCLYVAVFWLVTVLNRPWVLAEIFAIQSLKLFCMPSVTPLLSQDWLCLLLLLLTESSQRSFQSWQIMYKDFQLFTQLKPYLGPNHNSLLASTQHARRIYQLVNEYYGMHSMQPAADYWYLSLAKKGKASIFISSVNS